MPASSKISEVADDANTAIKDTEKTLRDLAERVEKAVLEGLEVLRAQGKTLAGNAGESLETAQHYVVERVQERPLATTAAALGVGLLLGLVIGGGRRR
ncbi:MAG: hypothetical protein P4L64_03520 [Caulobacteraceae bacterium]|nr:hypothetical protein [Caulobacteraceae bacterium]